MTPFIEDIINIRDTQLYFKYVYDDIERPTMVIVPGGPGFGCKGYQDFIMPFSDSVNLLFYDPRGRDKSALAKTLDEYTIHNEILDLQALIEVLSKKLNFDQVILHGTSYGSMLAQGFAGLYSEMLKKLILVTGAPSYEFFALAKQELAKRGDEEQKSICEKYLWPGRFDAQSLQEYFSQLSTLYSYTTKEKVKQYYDNPCNIEVLNRAFQTEYDHFDFTDGLKNITCPTLILAGRHDWINPPVLAEKTQRHIKNSKLIIFEDAAHSLVRDMPELYKQSINGFLNSPD